MLDAWALSNLKWKKRLAGYLYENRNLRNAACIHALNASEAAAIRSYGLENPIAIIPNGSDVPEYSAIASAARPLWLPDDGRRTLLFLGRLHPKKGLFNLISAWAKATNDQKRLLSEWQLIIAGWDDGGHQTELMALVNRLHLGESVLFPGPLHYDSKHSALSHADAFVLPSLSEGLPVAVLEAWAYGLPVLMTDHCNIPEGFAFGAALPIRTEVDALAVDILCALNRKDLKRVGSRGRELVLSQFSWESIATMYSELYDWILSGGQKPGFVSTF